MMVKSILLFCAQALMIQSIAGYCTGSRFEFATPCGGSCATAGSLAGPYGFGPYGLAAGPYGLAAGPYGPAAAAASNGGALPTSSTSFTPASGVSLVSENVYEGCLSAYGALPFLGTVALEGALPTAGAGAVAFGAGNGQVAMLREDIGATCGAGPYAFDALGYGAGPYARAGCGCGTFIY
ncbi:unnamed protein product, partial [Brenthis ino]